MSEPGKLLRRLPIQWILGVGIFGAALTFAYYFYDLKSSKSPTPTPKLSVEQKRKRIEKLLPTAKPEQSKNSSQFSPVINAVDLPTSDVIRVVLGIDGEKNLSTRLALLHSLEKISDEDREWLYACLMSQGEIAGLKPGASHALKDAIFCSLLQSESKVSETIDVFRAVYQDNAQDPIVRDYALQYLAGAFRSTNSVYDKGIIKEILVAAAKNVESGTMSGTAILGLESITRQDTAQNRELVGKLAWSSCQDTSRSQIERISALQVCGQLKMKQVAPLALKLAQNGDHVMVRMAAMATLGNVGDVESIDLLEKASRDVDIRIKTAASAALVRIKNRLHKSI